MTDFIPCDDCPPAGYGDKTRCRKCPWRNAAPEQARQVFRDATDPVVRLRVATEGMMPEKAILRLLELADHEAAHSMLAQPIAANLVYALLNQCHSAEQAMVMLVDQFISVAVAFHTLERDFSAEIRKRNAPMIFIPNPAKKPPPSD